MAKKRCKYGRKKTGRRGCRKRPAKRRGGKRTGKKVCIVKKLRRGRWKCTKKRKRK